MQNKFSREFVEQKDKERKEREDRFKPVFPDVTDYQGRVKQSELRFIGFVGGIILLVLTIASIVTYFFKP